MTKGIYQIRNKVNGKIYIGSAGNIQRRWEVHKRDLHKNIHPNSYLQRAWNKYGKDNFEFTVLVEIFDDSFLSRIEQEYLNRLNPYSSNGYNIARDATAPMRGMNHTEATRKKISEGNKGKIIKEETRKKLSDINKGKTIPEEIRKKISKTQIGRILTDTVREKISESKKGHIVSEVTRKKISEGNKCKIVSEITRQRMSIAKMGERNPNYGKHLLNYAGGVG